MVWDFFFQHHRSCNIFFRVGISFLARIFFPRNQSAGYFFLKSPIPPSNVKWSAHYGHDLITFEVKWSLLQGTYKVLLSIKGPVQEDLALGVQEDLVPKQVPVLNHDIAGLMILQVLNIYSLPKILFQDWLLFVHQSLWNALRCSGSSVNGHSRRRTALPTAAFTKSCFSQLPIKLAASPSYGHLFHVPRVFIRSWELPLYIFEKRICFKTGLVVYGKVCIQD